jgi:hypothetical protein
MPKCFLFARLARAGPDGKLPHRYGRHRLGLLFTNKKKQKTFYNPGRAAFTAAGPD